ncbi:MAG TPA: hypothetical protein EYN80_07580 [Alphaproteobacteria bacterium]|nr:hypothetical protein [Alphaproteobacteria bacterium]
MRIEVEEFLRRLEVGLRCTLPTMVTLSLVVLCAVPYGIPGLNKYFWSVHRPNLTPVLGHFLIGLLQDVLVGTPLGLSAAMFVGIHAAVHYQRPFFHGKTFLVLWFSFALLMTIIVLLSYMVVATYNLSFVPILPVLLQLSLTIAFYPLLTRIFQWTLRALMRTV